MIAFLLLLLIMRRMVIHKRGGKNLKPILLNVNSVPGGKIMSHVFLLFSALFISPKFAWWR